MKAIDKDRVLEIIDELAGQEDKIMVEELKKMVDDAPEITGIEWHTLEDEPPENKALLLSFVGEPYPFYGVYKDGVFWSIPDEDGKAIAMHDIGYIVNAWIVAPRSFE